MVGDARVVLKPGDFAFGPRGVPHGYRVAESGPARLLMMTGDRDFAEFVRELSEPAPSDTLPPPSEPDLERIVAAAARHGIEILGPDAGLGARPPKPSRRAAWRGAGSTGAAATQGHLPRAASSRAADFRQRRIFPSRSKWSRAWRRPPRQFHSLLRRHGHRLSFGIISRGIAPSGAEGKWGGRLPGQQRTSQQDR